MLGRTDTMLKFAIVHDWMAVSAGAEEVLREICDLYEGPVYTSQFNPVRFPWLEGRKVITSYVQRLPYSLTKHYIYAPLMPRVYQRFDLKGADVVLSDSHSFAHHVQRHSKALHICYYHTPARSLHFPEIDDRAASGRLKGVKQLVARRLKRLDLVAAKGPDVLLANSRTTADRIKSVYGRDVERVIYPPVDTKRWADVSRESQDEGLLFWGRLIPYKRVDLAIEAARITGDRLNIVGAGPSEAALKEQAAGMKNVRFHGRLPDEELKRLMSRSRAVLFPCYEDFGIVPVEAMAGGLPVVAYGVGGASETVTPEFGVQFFEQSPENVAKAVRALGEYDPAALRLHAAQYDRDVFRQQYQETVDAAVDRHFAGKAA